MAKAAVKTKTKKPATITVEPITQISVILNNVPGELATLAEALAAANVSIDGMGRTGAKGGAVTENLVVDDVEEAERILESQGKEFSATEILKFSCADDHPGVIAVIARKLADAEVNIENAFHASTGRGNAAVFYVAVKPSDFKKALELAKQIQ